MRQERYKVTRLDIDEFFTPLNIIESVRETLGRIDLDPASSFSANEFVKADRFFTKYDNALSRSWGNNSRIFLNPPKKRDLIDSFVHKLIYEIGKDNVSEAIVFVDNDTDSSWFQSLSAISSCAVFSKYRFNLINSAKNSIVARNGKVIFYYGKFIKEFIKNFSKYGVVFY